MTLNVFDFDGVQIKAKQGALTVMFTLRIAFLFLFVTGCNDPLEGTQTERTHGVSRHYTPTAEDCALPHGTVFQNCVSDDWLPSYWRSPVQAEGGREVRASEQVDHYVELTVLSTKEQERGNVLNVQYGYEPTNASVRLRAVGKPDGFVDLSQFEAGSLRFDVRVLDWGFANGLSVSVECGWPCASEAIDIPLAPLNEWRRVEIPVSMLVESGLDLSRVNSAVNITPTWNSPQGIHYQLDNILWVEQPPSNPLAISKRNWKKLARMDLEFIYQQAFNNHPGTIDSRNPAFREYLDSGYERAIASVGEVETAKDYADLIRTYMKSFNDGHFSVFFHRLPERILNSDDAEQASTTASHAPELSSIKRLEKGVYWVSFPSFQIQSESQREAINDVINRLEELPNDSKVVFDVRWNNGGSSAWGIKALKKLYGGSFVNEIYLRNGGAEHFAEFRVSEGTAKFYKKKSESIGLGHPDYELMLGRYQKINSLLQKGGDWYRPNSGSQLFKELYSFWYRLGSIESSVVPVLLTSEDCVSACLDFADLVVRLPNARHLGQETGSDTLYIDVRVPRPTLPSGLGKLTLPMKVWRKRFRDNNESYRPDVIYSGDIFDTRTVQQWVLTQLPLSD